MLVPSPATWPRPPHGQRPRVATTTTWLRFELKLPSLRRWLRVRHELIQSLERPPTRAQWANAVGNFGLCDAESLERFDEQLRIMVRFVAVN